MLDSKGKKWHPPSRPPSMTQLNDFNNFYLFGQRMILSDCEVTGVMSVGGDHLSTKIGNISKWRPKSKWPTKY